MPPVQQFMRKDLPKYDGTCQWHAFYTFSFVVSVIVSDGPITTPLQFYSSALKGEALNYCARMPTEDRKDFALNCAITCPPCTVRTLLQFLQPNFTMLLKLKMKTSELLLGGCTLMAMTLLATQPDQANTEASRILLQRCPFTVPKYGQYCALTWAYVTA